MRYIGNKENLIEKISVALKDRKINGNTFVDLFSGTTNVAKFFKRQGCSVISSDILYLSYCLQMAYISNNEEPKFHNLLSVIKFDTCNNKDDAPIDIVLNFLNNLKPISGFIYNNYSVGGTWNLEIPRMYLSNYNAKKIDAIRLKIEEWKNTSLITENEYYILLACLIESVGFFSNISGVYAAFRKKWDPRALKTFVIKPIKLIFNNVENKSFNVDSMTLLESINTDILYLDPPYNSRQYAPNYHLLETIAKYDFPEIHGITGMRNYDNQKSSFCSKRTALLDLEKIAKTAKYKYLLLSYNSEGIMSEEEIKSILSKYGDVELVKFQCLRFKSNSNGDSSTKRYIYEYLYILTSK